jgi:branched-subunit amino acid aminotransferase/4-amino-4-deoxychorismate lyase
MDGAIVPWREANVHVLSHGLHYGTSVFEGEGERLLCLRLCSSA